MPFKGLYGRATKMLVDEVEVPVCEIGDLIELKRRAGRARDLDDIAHLQELLGLREGNG